MADIIAIAGDTGSGKSTSIKNLNPQETFIVSILGKPLPFPGYKKKYIPLFLSVFANLNLSLKLKPREFLVLSISLSLSI